MGASKAFIGGNVAFIGRNGLNRPSLRGGIPSLHRCFDRHTVASPVASLLPF